jgi:nitrite reductase/ring-hydroxylating ferredoxin subunit/DMSO/TMAO reductase YedYZ heme-binding membrane subunit
MSVGYKAILWGKQKKQYDIIIAALSGLYLLSFIGFQMALHPEITPETLIIRASGTLALLMLHVILLIGPLARISSSFLPLLYNRRHLGVSMFLFALIHGAFSIFQFHGLGDTNAILSIFISNQDYASLPHFPFQTLGFFALIILFLMAASSHDYWLANLGSKFWKSMHMMVYFAYALIVMHVLLGVIQLEKDPALYSLLLLGMFSISGAHLYVAYLKNPKEKEATGASGEGFVKVCKVDEIPNNRAILAKLENVDVAVYRYDDRVVAVDNVCKHQQGPLSEGKVVDGCITCPWHGWQYKPEDGCSPPPFEEKVSTYRVRIEDGEVWVHPDSPGEGISIEPAKIEF